MMHYLINLQIDDNFPLSILLQSDVNNMFKTEVEPIGIRFLFFSCDMLSMNCVLYLGSCVCVCVGGGGLQLGSGYFLEKKKNIWFQK